MTIEEELTKIEEKNWFAGFWNLIKVELGGIKSLLLMTLLWVGVIDGILLMTGISEPEFELVMALYPLVAGFFPPIAVILISMTTIVEEKKFGTIAWILSKPVSRTTYIMAKWFAKSIYVFVSMCLIPGIVAYFVIVLLTGVVVSFLNFLLAICMIGLIQVFFVGFTIWLGTVVNNAGAVAAFPMVFNFTQQFIGGIPFVIYVLPIAIILYPTGYSIAYSIILGLEPFSYLPVVVTIAFVVIFPLLAIRQFNRSDF